MTSVAPNLTKCQGSKFGRRKTCVVNVCMAVAGLESAISVLAVPTGSVTTTLYVTRHFEVRDHAQPTKYVFNSSIRVAEIIGSLSANRRLQRLRLFPGWNLCSLAVSGPFPANGAEFISAAYQWNSETADYSSVTMGQTLTAGTVLWLKASTNAVVSILGRYAEPVARQLQSGGTYIPGTGLEAWSPRLPDLASSWDFDASTGQWSDQLTGSLASFSDPPPTLSPGQAFYIQEAAPAALEVPDPTLRVRYYHQDHLGSSSAITDDSGNLVEEIASYPFGSPRSEFQPRQTHDPYQFTQKERDLESGLHYFEARFLASTLSRFVIADPRYANPDQLPTGESALFFSNPQEMNLYTYVQNSPLRFTDPTGLGWFSDNICLPWQDCEVDWGRTAKVAGGVAFAVATGGTGLGVEFAVAGSLVAADQVSSGILDRPSYLHQAGTAICGGNEQCGTTLEGGTMIMMGGAATAHPAPPASPSVLHGSPPPPVQPWPDTIWKPPEPEPPTLPGWNAPDTFNNYAARAAQSAANRAAAYEGALNVSPRDAWFQATTEATSSYRYYLPTMEDQTEQLRCVAEAADQLFPSSK